MNIYHYSNDGTVSATMCGREGDKILFKVTYNGTDERYEYHRIKLYSWVRRLHGNAPAGTPYASFRASKNGKRVIITT